MMGVALVVELTEAAYGFSSLLEFFTPLTVKPGIPLSKNACSSSVAVVSLRTGEYCSWSAWEYAGLVSSPVKGFGAWPVWLNRCGFSSGTEKPYFAPCWANPAVTAAWRSSRNCWICAEFALISAPGDPAPVSGYAEFGAAGVALMNVDHGPTRPPMTLFQKYSVPRW